MSDLKRFSHHYGQDQPPSGPLTAVLDIGSSKTVCLIGEADKNISQNSIRVVGVGHQKSQGIRCGAIVDMESAVRAIRGAVEQAERMAGGSVSTVAINMTAGQLTSHRVRVDMRLAGRDVRERDLRRLLDDALAQFDEPHQVILHAMPVAWHVDGRQSVRDPRGMFTQTLGVDMHLVAAAAGPLRHIAACVERAHMDIRSVMASPCAAALATLVGDESELGCTIVDMGAGVTSVAVFQGGNLVFVDVIPVGGSHVTSDVARGLMTSLTAAERIKTMYGSILDSPDDDQEMIECPPVGGHEFAEPRLVPRTLLNSIIRPRLEETFEILRDRLIASGVNEMAGDRVVLTGGASQLSGVCDLAARILGKHVREGRPVGLTGLGEAVSGPAFSVAGGVLLHEFHGGFYDAVSGLPDLDGRRPKKRYAQSRMGSVFEWLKDNF